MAIERQVYKMGIKYYRLFDLLNRRGMKKSDLRCILSSATVAKLSKGEHISGEAIEKICEFLNCQPGDIMEYVVDMYDNIEKRKVKAAIYNDRDTGQPEKIIIHREDELDEELPLN